MFGTQFYPTPPLLAQRMVEPYADSMMAAGYRILDPSAGSGNLLEACELVLEQAERMKFLEYDLHPDRVENLVSTAKSDLRREARAIEIDGDLAAMLVGKGWVLAGVDFMSWSSPMPYDLWVMNPPFQNGEHHLLRAWDLSCPGAAIVCLLPTVMVRNPDTVYRRNLAHVIETYGSIEDLGPAFADADRPAGVDISLIRLRKPDPGHNLFDGIEAEPVRIITETDADSPDVSKFAVAKPDVVAALVQNYEAACRHYITYRTASRRMQLLEKQFDLHKVRQGGRGRSDEYSYSGATDTKSHAAYISDLNRAAWYTLFRLTGFEARMTSAAKTQFEKTQARYGNLEFTTQNIDLVLQAVMDGAGTILVQCVLDVYDNLTRYYKDNRSYHEGWCTNDRWAVGRKIILPGIGGGYNGRYDVGWGWRKDGFDDLDKAMCFVAGRLFENIDSIVKAVNATDRISGARTQSEFFDIVLYKKGTIHLTFRDPAVWRRFNQVVARERQWLRPGDDVDPVPTPKPVQLQLQAPE